MASELHMYVFNLLAQREGKAHRTTRTGSVDFGSLAQAAKEAAKEAERTVWMPTPACVPNPHPLCCP
jgi:hypothetical protein